MDNLSKALKVISILRQHYGSSSLHRNETPFYTLIFTVLSARNRDTQTEKATKSLFGKFPTMKSLAAAKTSEIEKSIRFIGLFRQKAKRVKQISQLLLQNYGGKVPAEMEELLKLPGVGRKTASCVLIYAYQKPAIAVDTHVHRISNRIGIVSTKTPEQTEKALLQLIPQNKWLSINELLVRHGQQICLPRNPKCAICPVRQHCRYYRSVFLASS